MASDTTNPKFAQGMRYSLRGVGFGGMATLAKRQGFNSKGTLVNGVNMRQFVIGFAPFNGDGGMTFFAFFVFYNGVKRGEARLWCWPWQNRGV